MQGSQATKDAADPANDLGLRTEPAPQPPTDGHPAGRWRRIVVADHDAGRIAGAAAAWDVDRAPAAVLVKQNALRRVYRVEHDGRAYFVKHHFQRGPAQRLKKLLLGSPAGIEYRASRYARAHGVPAVELVACAERIDDWRPHVSASVSVAIDGALALADEFERIAQLDDARERRAGRRALGDALARLIAAAHQAAFLHPDSHPGNVLVTRDATAGFACTYVDVYGARCGREVSDADAARTLAALHQWFAPRTSRTERLAFLKTYAGLRSRWASREVFRHFARRVAVAARRHTHELYRKRDRRIGRNNAFFARATLPDGQRAAVTLRHRSAARLLGEIPAYTPAEWVKVLSQPIGRAEAPPGAARLEMETLFADRPTTAFAWRVLGSPSWRRYRTACQALNRDLPAALGLACVTQSAVWGVVRADWVLGAAASGRALLRFLEDAPPAERRAALEAVGRLVADTVLHGLALRTLGAARIEIATDSHGTLRAYWVGVEGVALRGPARPLVALWMLGQLARSVHDAAQVTRADRVRVVQAYCRRAGERNWPEVLRSASLDPWASTLDRRLDL